MRLAMSILGLSLSSQAFAGGVGILATGGMYSETVYFYDSSTEFQQYQQPQTIGTYGTGIQVALGDRDDRIMGVARWYWLQETPQQDPAASTGLVEPENVVANWREDARNVVFSQWVFKVPSGEKISSLERKCDVWFWILDHGQFRVLPSRSRRWRVIPCHSRR